MDGTSTGQSPDPIILDFHLESSGTPGMVNVLLRDSLVAHNLLDLFEEAVDVFTEIMSLALPSGGVKVKIRLEFGESSTMTMTMDMLDYGSEVTDELHNRVEVLTKGTWARVGRAGGGHRWWLTLSRTRGEQPRTDRGSSSS